MSLVKVVNIVRLFLLFFIVYYLWQGTHNSAAIALGLFCGSLAIRVWELYVLRRRKGDKQIHTFLDPILDKGYIVVLCFFFWWQGMFWGWVLAFFLLRDLIVNRYRWLASKYEIVLKKDKFTVSARIVQYTLLLTIMIALVLRFSIFSFNLFLSLELIELIIAGVAVIIMGLSICYNTFNYVKGFREKKKLGQELEREKLVILANSSSRGFRDLYRRRLLKKFSKRRNAPIFYLNIKQKDLFKECANKIKDYTDVIIAGGDGTFESAVRSRWLRGKKIGFFPLGAGNAFYSYFYRGNKFEYLQSRFNFRQINLDVLEVEWDGGKKETLFFALGTDAEVIHWSKERTKQGFLNYFMGGVRVAFNVNTSYNLKVLVDSRKLYWDNCINFTLAKVPFYGFGMKSLVGKIDYDDGKVYGLACINHHSIIFNKTLRLWSLLLVQLGLGRSPLLPLQGKVFVVESDKEFPIQIGGEFLGYTKKVKVRVVRKQKVLVI